MWGLCDELCLSARRRFANSVKVKPAPARTNRQISGCSIISAKQVSTRVKYLYNVQEEDTKIKEHDWEANLAISLGKQPDVRFHRNKNDRFI